MQLCELEPGELECMSQVFLFQPLEAGAVRALIEDDRCTLEVFVKGQSIYTPTAFRRSLALLLTGAAQVTKGGLSVSLLKAGELFGAAALFTDRGEYETTVTARAHTRILFFPQALMSQWMGEYPVVSKAYVLYLSERIHFLNRKLDELLAPGAAEKLSRYLLTQSGPVECSATELARRLDVGRASLYRAFAELEAAGAIARQGKQILVLDQALLRQN